MSRESPLSWMDRAGLIYAATGLLLLLAPLFRSGKAPLGLLTLQMIALVLLALLFWQRSDPRQVQRSHLLALGLLLLLPLLQIIPLPAGMLDALSGSVDYTLAAELAWRGESERRATLSLNPRETLSAWLTLLLPVAVYLSARFLAVAQLQKLMLLLLAGAGLQAVLGLVQFGGGPDSPFYLGMERAHFGSAIGTYTSRNNYVGYLYLSLMACLALYFSTLGRHRRRAGSQSLRQRLLFLSTARGHRAFLLGALCLLLLLAIVFSRSRAGIGLTMLGVVLASIAFSRRIGGDNVYGMTGTIIAVLAGIAVSIGLAPVLDRFSANDALTDGRWTIFEGVLQGIGRFMPFGSGAGTFRETFHPFHDISQAVVTINRAHNDYLEWLYTGGLPAGMLIALFLAFYAARWPQLWKAGSWGEFRYLQVGAGLGMLLMLLHELVDYNLMVPANMIFFAFFAGVFFCDYREPARRESRSPGREGAEGQPTPRRGDRPRLQPVNTGPMKNPFHDE